MRFAIAALFVAFLTVIGAAQAPQAPAAQVPAPSAPPGAPVAGEGVFNRSCVTCHAANNTVKAPTPDVLKQLAPEAIVNALVNGKMAQQGSSLTDAERRAVAEYLTGKTIGVNATAADIGKCTTNKPMTDLAKSPSWSGWGAAITNTRYVPNGGLTAADLPKLKLKWAFGYHDVAAARGQPAVAGGRVFAGNENSEVVALDMKTGCRYWTYKALAGVRSALSVGPIKAAGSSGTAVFFGDQKANIYAVDASTGKQIWVKKIDEHPSAAITGAPTVANGRIYVGIQGLSEEGQGGRGGYACCTFRGSVNALDANTGAVLWKTYTIEPNKPRGVDKNGVQMFGPAGGGIWSSPTIDPKRRMVYVATGNGYADPVQKTTDAVIALDINSGAIKWVRQATPGDSWVGGCPQKNDGTNVACPEALGPDFDFSAPPTLVTVNGKDRLVLPQKSGITFALDPDNEGAIVWQTRIGQGSGFGGQWGLSSDGTIAYVGVGDMQSPTPGGLKALRMADGSIAWAAPPQPTLCRGGRGCNAGQGSATTLVPGAVLSGSIDGGLRAYSTANGDVIWTFDTNKTYDTVNGVKASGASLEGAGPIVAGGMLFINSGYGGIAGRPGNVLLAFGLD